MPELGVLLRPLAQLYSLCCRFLADSPAGHVGVMAALAIALMASLAIALMAALAHALMATLARALMAALAHAMMAALAVAMLAALAITFGLLATWLLKSSLADMHRRVGEAPQLATCWMLTALTAPLEALTRVLGDALGDAGKEDLGDAGKDAQRSRHQYRGKEPPPSSKLSNASETRKTQQDGEDKRSDQHEDQTNTEDEAQRSTEDDAQRTKEDEAQRSKEEQEEIKQMMEKVREMINELSINQEAIIGALVESMERQQQEFEHRLCTDCTQIVMEISDLLHQLQENYLAVERLTEEVNELREHQYQDIINREIEFYSRTKYMKELGSQLREMEDELMRLMEERDIIRRYEDMHSLNEEGASEIQKQIQERDQERQKITRELQEMMDRYYDDQRIFDEVQKAKEEQYNVKDRELSDKMAQFEVYKSERDEMKSELNHLLDAYDHRKDRKERQTRGEFNCVFFKGASQVDLPRCHSYCPPCCPSLCPRCCLSLKLPPWLKVWLRLCMSHSQSRDDGSTVPEGGARGVTPRALSAAAIEGRVGVAAAASQTRGVTPVS
ncbi:golgin subfamily A member 6-like protein 22 [Procambarus clarkii]|uniref:golgin subfamily A member 6-like protein 22 n=1 Tax=Procambarus clarkii TaxID=6728 RepID=UPI0037431934